MSYSKKNRYPSIKTPGVYRDATDEQLGLNNDDLENFSLGNWNTTFRGNKLLLSASSKYYTSSKRSVVESSKNFIYIKYT